MLFSAVGTIQAYQQLQQNHQRILAGDITTVDSWMTLPYVARVYHVPEACLYPSLHLPNTWTVRHSTLRSIADRYKRPVDKVIHDVQQVIISYRAHHSMCGPPASPTPKTASFAFRQRFSFAARKGAFHE
jgi:hypothetical protein